MRIGELLFAVTLICVIGASFGCGRPGPNAEVASVDGRPILLSDLRRMVEWRYEVDPNALPADVLTEELDRLVNQRVAQNRAQELGISVSDGEVEARIRLVHGDDFDATDPNYLEEVRETMQIDRAAISELAPSLRIPESALADYFEAHKGEYTKPERVLIRQIVVEDRDRAGSLLDKIKAGGDFEKLAAENSQAPEAAAGGLLPAFGEGDLPEAFDRAFELEAGQLSDVIESPHGYHIFLLIEKYPAEEPELGDIRDQLMTKLAQEQLADLRPQWLRDLRRSAEIRVNERLLETLKR